MLIINKQTNKIKKFGYKLSADDSYAAMWAIASIWCKSQLIRGRIRLRSIPDHSGILSKETVDALSRLVLLLETI